MDHPRTLTESGWKFSYGILNDDDFIEVIPEGDISKDVNMACFVARNDFSKGIMDIPRIMAYLKNLTPKIRVIIAGSIPKFSIRQKLENEIRNNNLQEYITIKGFIGEREKEELLRKAAIFIFPSYEDSWSLAVMEAAAYGCVPVTYDLPAYDYLGPSAVKVPVGNTEQMARVIHELICDKERRIRISKDLKDAVKKYNIKDIAMYQLDYFSRMLQDTRNNYNKDI